MSLPLAPQSTIGQKIVMAISGLLIIGFLVAHFTGNLLLFVGRDAFNLYAHKLTSTPLIYVAETGLLLIFLYHMVTGIRLTLANKAARGDAGYRVKQRLGEGTLMSKTMAVSGIVILVFLVLHICTFKFGTDVSPDYVPVGHTDEVRDLYSLVVTEFGKAWYVAIYVVAMIAMGLHLAHAFQSACRTLGLSDGGYAAAAKKLSVAIAVAFAVGFSSFPLYFLANGKPPAKAPQVQVETVEGGLAQ